MRTAKRPNSAPLPPLRALACPQEERRERDARAIKTFEAGVAAISEEMEQKVLEASYALRDGLEEAEQAVATVRGELDVDDRLVEGDMAYVEVRSVCSIFTRGETPVRSSSALCTPKGSVGIYQSIRTCVRRNREGVVQALCVASLPGRKSLGRSMFVSRSCAERQV